MLRYRRRGKPVHYLLSFSTSHREPDNWRRGTLGPLGLHFNSVPGTRKHAIILNLNMEHLRTSSPSESFLQ